MHKFHASLFLAIFFLTYVSCEPYSDHSAITSKGHPGTFLSGSANILDAGEGGDDDDDEAGDMSNYDKRVERYAFGLGRRAYTYGNGGNGVKRLPVYNFGLGKRARPYSFGLGKRGNAIEFDGVDDAQYADDDLGHNSYMDQIPFMDEKRNRPYSFGLGKRDGENNVNRRVYASRYGFGLGRR